MRRLISLVSVLIFVSCAVVPQDKQEGHDPFSFAEYDFVVIENRTSLAGIDDEFGELMNIYGMQTVTAAEYESMSVENRARTLKAIISLVDDGGVDSIDISFKVATDEGAKKSFGSAVKGDIDNTVSRSKVLQSVADKIIKELKEDKGLSAGENKLLADERDAILPGARSKNIDEPAKEYVVIANTLNVRKAPMIGFDVIEKVKKGDVLKKISSLLGWIKVELPSGRVGWVSMKYLQAHKPQ